MRKSPKTRFKSLITKDLKQYMNWQIRSGNLKFLPKLKWVVLNLPLKSRIKELGQSKPIILTISFTG
jgi:hypothetical protein